MHARPHSTYARPAPFDCARIFDTGEELHVDHIEITKYKNGVKKTKKIAQGEFEVERMGADEYDRIKELFLEKLLQAVHQDKSESEEKKISLTDRGNHVATRTNNHPQSKKTHQAFLEKMKETEKQLALSKLASDAAKESRASQEKQKELDEKHAEEIRDAVKTEVSKNEVKKSEDKKKNMQ